MDSTDSKINVRILSSSGVNIVQNCKYRQYIEQVLMAINLRELEAKPQELFPSIHQAGRRPPRLDVLPTTTNLFNSGQTIDVITDGNRGIVLRRVARGRFEPVADQRGSVDAQTLTEKLINRRLIHETEIEKVEQLGPIQDRGGNVVHLNSVVLDPATLEDLTKRHGWRVYNYKQLRKLGVKHPRTSVHPMAIHFAAKLWQTREGMSPHSPYN